MSGLVLAPESVEAVARRVVELLRFEGGAAPAGLLTAAQVAERFSVDRSWIYSHADELGAMRLGEGRKPRLRFDAERVAAALRSREASERSRGPGIRGVVRDPGVDAGPLVPNELRSLPKRWREAAGGGGVAS